MKTFYSIVMAVLSILGCVLGAGFVSGAEIVAFFCKFGWLGIMGIVMSSLIFCIGIYIIFRNCKISSSNDLVNFVPFCQIFISATMFSGLSSMFDNKILINFVLLIMLILCLCFGIKCANFINSIVAISVILILPFVINQKQIAFNFCVRTHGTFIVYSLLYGLMNIVTSMEVIKSVTTNKNKKTLAWLLIIIFVIITALQLIVYFLCMNSKSQMPMLDNLSGVLLAVYQLILILAMSSTIVSSSVGAKNIFTKILGEKANICSSIFTGCVILIFSWFGFSNIINYIYPIIGLVLLLQILINLVSKRKNKHKNAYKSCIKMQKNN